MGFWFYMLISALLIPLIMIIFGRYFSKKAPKDINYIFGYRTAMSMKNEETWEFAHKHFGKTWFTAGMILLPVTVAVMLALLGQDKDTVGYAGTVIMFVQTALLIILIIPTESALKKNFDKDGNRK